jgi:hypothetical protein
MEVNDILKLISLTQAEINALTDKVGLYFNSTTGKLNLNGTDMSSGDMDAATYDPNNVQDDAFDYSNFLGTFQIKGSSTTVTMSSDIDNLDVDGYNIVYLTASSDDRRITGIKAPPSGVNRVIYFFNNDSNRRKKFVGNSGSSLANNRIVLRGNAASRNLEDYQVAQAIYNHSINKWFITRIA